MAVSLCDKSQEERDWVLSVRPPASTTGIAVRVCGQEMLECALFECCDKSLAGRCNSASALVARASGDASVFNVP